jgi:hypothetical protein
MTENQIKVLRQLRDEGYAVCVFTPDEMFNSSIEDVEDAMCEGGWNQINLDSPIDESISA